jgi:hypothetical protein
MAWGRPRWPAPTTSGGSRMTANQQERLDQLAAYVRRSREQGHTPNLKEFREFCTNILASVILIEKDE